ncbi:MAG: hypothetical protein HY544_03730 [Candidatus Diapherotrites archaeon]|uniref:Uncharacterized protein n=1 Tax=Candidatus Iainarchaeum sp. TaxID=3101447 RepID=A0A8T3YLP3_9ARCH|nr:hypothetical protein [Candidatus Diapherotrites archaeon]
MAASAFSREQKREVRKFSVAFALLSIFPALVVFAFIALAGVRLGFFGIEKGLAVLLAVLVAAYIAMPRIASAMERAVAKSGAQENPEGA